jgi:hypothetical protein
VLVTRCVSVACGRSFDDTSCTTKRIVLFRLGFHGLVSCGDVVPEELGPGAAQMGKLLRKKGYVLATSRFPLIMP